MFATSSFVGETCATKPTTSGTETEPVATHVLPTREDFSTAFGSPEVAPFEPSATYKVFGEVGFGFVALASVTNANWSGPKFAGRFVPLSSAVSVGDPLVGKLLPTW